MKINYHRTFRKQYRKLPLRLQERVNKALACFQKDPLDRDLHNHQLKGKLKGKRAIVAEHDLRIVFEAQDDHKNVTLLSVGSHDAVY